MGQAGSKLPGASKASILEAVANNDLEQVKQILRSRPSKVLAIYHGGSREGRGVWHVAAAHGHVEVMTVMRDMVEAAVAEAVAAGYIHHPHHHLHRNSRTAGHHHHHPHHQQQHHHHTASGAHHHQGPHHAPHHNDIHHKHQHHHATPQHHVASDAPKHIRKLLKLGHSARAILAALVNQRDAKDHAPLHLAAMHGHAACVELLLALGADPWAADAECGRTPLHFAAAHGRVGAIAALLAQPLPAASSGLRREPNTLKTRLVDARSAHGFTPLHYAVWAGNADAIRALVSFEAFICARSLAQGDDWIGEAAVPGSTPLHLAAHKGELGAARTLLAAYVHSAAIPDLPSGAQAAAWQQPRQQQRRLVAVASGGGAGAGSTTTSTMSRATLAALQYQQQRQQQQQGSDGGLGHHGGADANPVSNNATAAGSDAVATAAVGGGGGGNDGGDVSGRENDGQRRRRMEPRIQGNSLRQLPITIARLRLKAVADQGGDTSALAALVDLLQPDMPLGFALEPEDVTVAAVRLYGPPRLAIIAAEALQSKLMNEIQTGREKDLNPGARIQIHDQAGSKIQLQDVQPADASAAAAAAGDVDATAIIATAATAHAAAATATRDTAPAPDGTAPTAIAISTDAAATAIPATTASFRASLSLVRAASAAALLQPTGYDQLQPSHLLLQPTATATAAFAMVNSISSLDLPALARSTPGPGGLDLASGRDVPGSRSIKLGHDLDPEPARPVSLGSGLALRRMKTKESMVPGGWGGSGRNAQLHPRLSPSPSDSSSADGGGGGEPEEGRPPAAPATAVAPALRLSKPSPSPFAQAWQQAERAAPTHDIASIAVAASGAPVSNTHDNMAAPAAPVMVPTPPPAASLAAAQQQQAAMAHAMQHYQLQQQQALPVLRPLRTSAAGSLQPLRTSLSTAAPTPALSLTPMSPTAQQQQQPAHRLSISTGAGVAPAATALPPNTMPMSMTTAALAPRLSCGSPRSPRPPFAYARLSLRSAVTATAAATARLAAGPTAKAASHATAGGAKRPPSSWSAVLGSGSGSGIAVSLSRLGSMASVAARRQGSSNGSSSMIGPLSRALLLAEVEAAAAAATAEADMTGAIAEEGPASASAGADVSAHHLQHDDSNGCDDSGVVCGICLEGPRPLEGCHGGSGGGSNDDDAPGDGAVVLLAASPCGHQLCTGCAGELCRMHRIKPARCPFCRGLIGGFGGYRGGAKQRL